MVILANALVDRGFKIDLLLASATGAYLEELSKQMNVIDFNTSRILPSFVPLATYLRHHRPEVLLSSMRHANLIALSAKQVARVQTRVVVSERNDPLGACGSQKRLNSSLIRAVCRFLYRTADRVHAVSSGVADSLCQQLKLPLSRVDVVYNPIPLKEINRLAVASAQLPNVDLDDRPLISAAGRLSTQKDFAMLIRAFKRVRQECDSRLVIMGEGKNRPELEALIAKYSLENDVLLPGFISNPFAIMRQSDLFVLSSRWEGLPNVLIQAMAVGTPVVSTDCKSGPAEILENGKWGRLVPVGDTDALAKAMLDTLYDKKHPDVKRRAADFGVDQAVDGYLRLLFPEEAS